MKLQRVSLCLTLYFTSLSKFASWITVQLSLPFTVQSCSQAYFSIAPEPLFPLPSMGPNPTVISHLTQSASITDAVDHSPPCLKIFIHFFVAVLGFHCFAHVFCSCSEQGLFFVAVYGLPLLWSRLQAPGFSTCSKGAQWLWFTGYGILPDQGSNLFSLH